MDKVTENPAVEQHAAETILQRGIKVALPAPLFLRLFGKKHIIVTLRSPFEGTMHRVAIYYLSTGLTQDNLEKLTTEEALALMAVHGKAIGKAVACAILNGYWSGKLLTRPFAWYLRWHLTPHKMFAFTTALLIYGGVSDFINTTRSIRTMKLTSPNLGQTNTSQGS